MGFLVEGPIQVLESAGTRLSKIKCQLIALPLD